MTTMTTITRLYNVPDLTDYERVDYTGIEFYIKASDSLKQYLYRHHHHDHDDIDKKKKSEFVILSQPQPHVEPSTTISEDGDVIIMGILKQSRRFYHQGFPLYKIYIYIGIPPSHRLYGHQFDSDHQFGEHLSYDVPYQLSKAISTAIPDYPEEKNDKLQQEH